MRISEVTLTLVHPEPRGEGVLAYVGLVMENELAIKGIRWVRRADGTYLASMPNRERQQDCKNCDTRNNLTNKRCHHCGAVLKKEAVEGRIFVDMVHPTNRDLRKYIEGVIEKEYQRKRSSEEN